MERNIIGFNINIIPGELLESPMNDRKLTFEEYKIRDKLIEDNLPIKLVQAQHGLWNYNTAIIALELL